ncbi:MAG: hemK [Steroidobacteraceae bacterium]|nr:hemK [Steroidobacteraceae bacterium]
MATEVSALLDEGVARLRRVTDQPRQEAEILLAAALARPRSWVIAHPEQRIHDCDATDRYEAHVTRRAHGEPVAYILGEKEFWSLPLEVTPHVLIPRPETELAVEVALAHLPLDAPGRVLDLATGSGAIALAIAHERPRLQVIGTDIASEAVDVARRNAVRVHVQNVEFRVGDWYGPVRDEHFTLIVSNPPYVADDDARVERAVRRFEPHAALFAGPDGLDALRVVVGEASRHLVSGGWLVVEHGDRQGPDARTLLVQAGFTDVATRRDPAGLDRCTEGRSAG